MKSLQFVAGITLACARNPQAVERHWWEDDDVGAHRNLQSFLNDTATCFSTLEEDSPNRYCIFESTPRDQTFLLLSCPDSRGEDVSKCECEIGVGLSEDAPNTPTCSSCSFCSDGSLEYSCANVARGTCIGRTCDGSCVASLEYTSDAALLGMSTLFSIMLVPALLL